MYIEQLKNNKDSLLKYLPFSLAFFIFMAFNLIASSLAETNTQEALDLMVEQMGKNMTLVMVTAPLAFLLLLLLLWVRFFHGQSIRSLTTARPKTDWKRILFSFALWSLFLIISTGISYYINPSDYEINFKPVPFIFLIIISIIFVPLQTSFEEYFFRGYLMQGLGLATKTRWFPLVFTSVMFGLIHVSNPEVLQLGPSIMIFYIGTGFFLGIITLMDDGMELALGFHAANNVMLSLLVTSKTSALQSEALLIDISDSSNSLTEIILQVFLIFPILLFILAKKYGWNDWKRKLTQFN